MDRPKLIIMCGLSGSGKSTKAKDLAEEYDATVFSSDALREEMYGDINNQEHNQELFAELHRRVKKCIKNGRSAIIDSTNISRKKRVAFLTGLQNIPCEKICVLMATPYKECLLRNAKRERKVPEYVVERMYRAFDPPYWYEGWDDIKVVFSSETCRQGLFNEWISSAWNFNQDNPHHKLTLGQHCEAVLDHIFEDVYDNDNRSVALRAAGGLHDLGKCFCKTFKNNRGEVTEYAHYYNHEHTGSYDSLFFLFVCNPLDVAILIRWHMMPYVWEKDNNEKLHNRYRALWGEELYQDIMRLHEADKAAH